MRKAIYRSTIRDRWLRLIGIPFFSVVFPLLQYSPYDWRFPYTVAVSLVTTTFIWEGNRYFIVFLRKWLSWERYAVVHLLVQGIGTIIFTVFMMWLSYRITFDMIFREPLDREMFLRSRSLVIISVLMMNAIYEGMYFAERWRHSVTRAEVLKRENLRSQYESLKHQVNPHFLFNSLNTLTALIEEDESLALRFVDELGAVYKYVLESVDRPTVTLDEELKFATAYVFLLKMRFGDNLQTHLKVTPHDRAGHIPPLTLQLLIENAVKHNIIGRDKPLHIHLEARDSTLLVWNNLQRKQTRDDSTQVGLSNIRERYDYLVHRPVVVRETSDRFEVELPKI